jgi:hypothetical protein
MRERSGVAFFGLVRLVNNPVTPGLGAGAGPGDEPAEGQGGLGRVASRSATAVAQRVRTGARLTRIGEEPGVIREAYLSAGIMKRIRTRVGHLFAT